VSKRVLPEQDIRVETGVTQFGDDWPGVFIRGDDAFAFALYLESVERTGDEINVEGLLNLLRECDVRNED
jgi:hypothetical protein